MSWKKNGEIKSLFRGLVVFVCCDCVVPCLSYLWFCFWIMSGFDKIESYCCLSVFEKTKLLWTKISDGFSVKNLIFDAFGVSFGENSLFLKYWWVSIDW